MKFYHSHFIQVISRFIVKWEESTRISQRLLHQASERAVVTNENESWASVLWFDENELICNFKEIEIQVLHRWNVLISKGKQNRTIISEVICPRVWLIFIDFIAANVRERLRRQIYRKIKSRKFREISVNPFGSIFINIVWSRQYVNYHAEISFSIRFLFLCWLVSNEFELKSSSLANTWPKCSRAVINNIIAFRLAFTHTHTQVKFKKKKNREHLPLLMTNSMCTYAYIWFWTRFFSFSFVVSVLFAFEMNFHWSIILIECYCPTDWLFSLSRANQERARLLISLIIYLPCIYKREREREKAKKRKRILSSFQ